MGPVAGPAVLAGRRIGEGCGHRMKHGDDVDGLDDNRPPINGSRSSAQIAGLTTLMALSDDSYQPPQSLGTVPFPKLRPHQPEHFSHAPGGSIKLSPRPSTAQRQRIRTIAAMNHWQRKQYWIFAGFWLLAGVYFWKWWALPSHAGNLGLFIVLSTAWFYSTTLLPTFYLFYLGRMRRPVPMSARRAEELHVIGRVAVITLTVPGSESLEIVRQQVAAMKGIKYPHDCWILVDKEHSPEIKRLARQLGVFYFSRHDTAAWGKGRVARWNSATPPFKAGTKAGNVNSWLDAYSHRYTHFTQLDIDHHPAPNYLDSVLGFFEDPNVAWVQAPSVYSNHQYWTARGSSEQEVVLQGPLQMGFYGFSRTPFIIGSHCTYDTKAICDIGGFQPTRAEDHLDTVFLAAQGREGVYFPGVIATGDGPENFEIYLAQQFAWAFSMIQVLFKYTPRLLHRYTLRQAFQFLFAQTWYTFWSMSMLIVFMSPLVSLVLNRPISNVSLIAFLSHSIPAGLVGTGIWWWSRSWHQPRVGLSWRGIALHMARWVVVLSALAQVILGVKKPYMITAKGIGGAEQRPIRLTPLIPYIGLILLSLGTCWFYMAIYHSGKCQGYMFFAIEESALFWLLLILILVQDIRALRYAKISMTKYLRLRATPSLVAVLIAALLVATIFASYSLILQAWSNGFTWPSL
jgi:cellulose synthase (UDP-forming)